MLILSRRLNDGIVFPDLGVTVKILRIAGRAVRVGVSAPPGVAVLRHELVREDAGAALQSGLGSGGVRLTHAMRNRLNTASLAIHLAQKQLDCGRTAEAEGSLEKALEEFGVLDREIGQQRDLAASAALRTVRHTLVVEDDANESELLAGFLRMSGFQVDTAGDGCDALDYLTSHELPDVVLLDMHMPRCDGPTTVSAIRRNAACSGVKIFAVSGVAPQQLSVPVGPGGVDRWFSKPLNPQTLVEVMKRELAPPSAAAS